MKQELNVSRGLSLPLEFVTTTSGLLAVRGAGKTNAARAIAEEMFAAGLPFVAIDPVGSWYGLRAGRDGKASGGLPIVIFGGDHGDIPLTRQSGQLIADLVVEERLTCVIDLSGFASEADKKHFLLAFAQRLYQKNRNPLHLFLEEADDYIPQRPLHDELQLKRAWENIVRRGRSRGIGMTIITQRSAVVNKDVLTQVETLFVLRTTGPQDIKAIEEWTKFHDFGRDKLGTLSSLEDGEAWVWSPHFLKEMKRFKFRMSTTFDSGATPKNVRGTTERKTATLHDIDVGKIRQAVEATIEKVKGEDPKALRVELRERESTLAQVNRELEQLRKAKAEKPVKPVDLKQLAALVQKLSTISNGVADSIEKLVGIVGSSRRIEASIPEKKASNSATARPKDLGAEPPKKEPKAPKANAGDSRLQACPRALLNVLVAKHPSSVSAAQLSILSGYSAKSSGFNNGISTLRTGGYLVGGRDEMLATELGIQTCGDVTPIPTGKEALEYWKGKLDKCPATLLQVIYDAGHPVGKAHIAESSGYSLASSGFNNGLSTLRTLKLIEGYSEMKVADSFYE